eukprot:g21801.t1
MASFRAAGPYNTKRDELGLSLRSQPHRSGLGLESREGSDWLRYFLWRFLALSHSMDFYNEAYAWPLLVYMLVICLYPFISSCAHTFSTMSAHVRHVCYFLDYGALSLYSL